VGSQKDRKEDDPLLLEFSSLKERVTRLEERFTLIERLMSSLEQRIDRLEKIIEKIDGRVWYLLAGIILSILIQILLRFL
jgi:uncharacterized coiled-coil protein SlyX